jgi:hypothetical protein
MMNPIILLPDKETHLYGCCARIISQNFPKNFVCSLRLIFLLHIISNAYSKTCFEQSNGGAEDDEVDPLDAFMAGIQQELTTAPDPKAQKQKVRIDLMRKGPF